MLKNFVKNILLGFVLSTLAIGGILGQIKNNNGSTRIETLSFVVSAKNLPGKDTDKRLDPFLKVYLGEFNGMFAAMVNNDTEGEGPKIPIDLKPVDISEYLTNEINPEWNRVFSVPWLQGKSQKLYLEIRDHDPFGPDDSVGDATIDLDVYVSKGQEITTPLHITDTEPGSSSDSYITLMKTEPFSFTLAARNLPKKDEFQSKSDPYVECYFRKGKDGKDNLFYTTTVINNEENPTWNTPIYFPNYQNGTNQYFHFKVKDHDSITSDDDLGEALMEIDPFVGHPTAKNLALANENDGAESYNSALVISYLK